MRCESLSSIKMIDLMFNQQKELSLGVANTNY